MKIQLFLILALRSLELSFSTQVLRTGQVLILGMDEFGREKMRFYMPRENDERDSIKEEKVRNSSVPERQNSVNDPKDYAINQDERATFQEVSSSSSDSDFSDDDA